MRTFRCALGVLLILFCIWFLLPLVKGITHIGMFYPVLLLIPLICVMFRPSLLKGGKRKKMWIRAVACGYLLVFLACGVTLGFMIRGAEKEPAANSTVVVLGCMVYGERPSRMLTDRCEAAYEYLAAHPDAVCVAAGGQGPRENISEAEAIFVILTEKGIAPERIYLEDTSTDTEENLENTAKIIEANGLSPRVAIATDEFHEFRAGIYGQRAGLETFALPSSTYLFVAPGYWAREILAVWEALFLA